MSAQDEMQAELETDFTHFVFSEDNNGYLALYSAGEGRADERHRHYQGAIRRHARARGREQIRRFAGATATGTAC